MKSLHALLPASAVATLAILSASLPVTAATVVPKGFSAEQLQLALDSAETKGAALFRHERAASIALAHVMKLREFKGDKRVTGWVTEEKDADMLVTFIGGREGEQPLALYRVTVGEKGKVASALRLKAPETLTDYESGATAARRLALSSGYESCSEKYHAVAIPTETGADRTWAVFLLPGATKPNAVPLGGTHRVDTDWYAENVLAKRAYSRSCAAIEYDNTAAALYVTHPLDPLPTEAHVFWSLWANKPLIVNTSADDLMWAIEAGQIRQLDN